MSMTYGSSHALTLLSATALKGHYKAKDLPTAVDASRPMEEVTAELLEALGHPDV